MEPAWLNELQNAMELLERGEPKAGLKALHEILQEHGEDEFCRALVFDGMGNGLFMDGQPALAMEAFAESLKLAHKLHEEGKVSAQFMQGVLQNQAHAFLIQGNNKEAEKLGREAVALAEKTWGTDSPETAQALFHLSAPFYAEKDYDTAERVLLRSKEIWEKQEGEIPEQLGTILNNLGRIYEERDKPEHGASYHRRAVEVRRRLPNKEDLAFSLGNYGVALGSAGKLDEACNALRESIVIYNAIGKANTEEAKAFAANLELFENALAQKKG